MGALSGRTDTEDDERQWCPHCGGRLGAPRRLLQHPSFDDVRHRILDRDGIPIRCTPAEWEILCALREEPRRILARPYLLLLRPVKKADDPDDKVVEVHLSHLRKKLAKTPYRIETVYAAGWMLVARDDP